MKNLIIASLVLLCASAFADQVVLTNGDRLTGVIKKFDDQKLYLKTDYSDEIVIKWSAVNKIVGDKPLHVERADAPPVEAPTLIVSGTDVTAEGAAVPVTVPGKDIKTIRSSSEQVTYEQSLHPNWRQAWQGGGSFGVALARGNSDTTNIALGFTADRKTSNDKTSVYANSVYATDGILNTTSANSIRGGIRYDHDFSKRWFGFVSADFEHDAVQSLDLRSILGAGLGYHAINTKATSLDFLGGAAYTHESYGTGLTNNFVSLVAGEQFSRKINANTTFTQSAFIYPYMNSLGNYRATFDAGLATKISRILTWQINFGDRYVTNPLPGTKKNDLLLTTGLGVTFGKKE
jgi:putative salt-induced outer membrane protein